MTCEWVHEYRCECVGVWVYAYVCVCMSVHMCMCVYMSVLCSYTSYELILAVNVRTYFCLGEMGILSVVNFRSIV